MVRALGKTNREVLDELAASDELTGRVHASFEQFPCCRPTATASCFDKRMLEMRGLALEV